MVVDCGVFVQIEDCAISQSQSQGVSESGSASPIANAQRVFIVRLFNLSLGVALMVTVTNWLSLRRLQYCWWSNFDRRKYLSLEWH